VDGLCALALLQESLWTFADPARRASIPNLCRPEELNLANALGGATWSIMLAFGAALGGFTTAYFGWRTAILSLMPPPFLFQRS
jgi:MFS family permease